jgi:hypothetical protein
MVCHKFHHVEAHLHLWLQFDMQDHSANELGKDFILACWVALQQQIVRLSVKDGPRNHETHSKLSYPDNNNLVEVG